MTATPDLIETLAAAVVPVRRLPPPGVRAVAWVALALALIGVLAVLHGVRPDLMDRLHQPAFVLGAGASLLTGSLAAFAALMTSLPDRSRFWVVLPLPMAAVWVSSIGYGCLTDWVRLGAEGIQFGEALNCFLTLLLSSVPLSALMFWMIGHAARLRPRVSILCGAGAVAALTATALSILHRFDASAMILIWNFGAAFLIVAVNATVGRRWLTWRGW